MDFSSVLGFFCFLLCVIGLLNPISGLDIDKLQRSVLLQIEEMSLVCCFFLYVRVNWHSCKIYSCSTVPRRRDMDFSIMNPFFFPAAAQEVWGSSFEQRTLRQWVI